MEVTRDVGGLIMVRGLDVDGEDSDGRVVERSMLDVFLKGVGFS